MRIVVDGLPVEVPDEATVLEVLERCDEPTTHVIVEINGSFVHPDTYRGRVLKPGDKMEVVYPAFGG